MLKFNRSTYTRHDHVRKKQRLQCVGAKSPTVLLREVAQFNTLAEEPTWTLPACRHLWWCNVVETQAFQDASLWSLHLAVVERPWQFSTHKLTHKNRPNFFLSVERCRWLVLLVDLSWRKKLCPCCEEKTTQMDP